MKTRIFKSLLALMLTFVALPMMAQDYMNIFFKNGDFRKFYMKNITEIVASKVDADGVRHSNYDYQHITTIHDKYIYSLADVDSITFTKIDEEKLEENFESSMMSLVPIIYECKTIEDAENKLNDIRNINGVKDAWSDGHVLSVKVDEWETISIHFNHTNKPYSDVNEDVRKMLPMMKNINKPSGKRLLFGIANQTNYDVKFEYDRKNYYHPLISLLNANNIDARYIEKPSLDFFYKNSDNIETDPHLYDFDAVILDTHGAYVSIFDNDLQREKMIHRFATAEELGSIRESLYELDILELKKGKMASKLQKIRDKYKDATDQHIYLSILPETRDGKEYVVFYAGVTEKFFEQIAIGHFSNPNSIFYNCACESLKGYRLWSTYAQDEKVPANYSMANTFIDKGLGTYIGFNQSVSISPSTSCHLFLSMLNGKSLDKACYDLDSDNKSEVDNGKTAFLMRVPDISEKENGKTFLLPTYTDPVSHEKVMEDFNNNSAVTVSGTMTSPVPQGIDGGFFYGTDKDNLSINKDSESAYTTLNLGKGNIVFSAQLEKLEPGKTYYYCAYTYDGLYYNYGDTCSFTIDKVKDLSIAIAGNIDLEVGASTNVRIMSGSGDYTLSSDKPNVAKPSLAGEFITVEALSAGKATITVTDNITKQTASFTVTVTASTPAEETLLETTVEGVGYRIYKRNIDKNNVRLNGDGHEFYKTQMALDVTKNGQKQTYVVDNAIYLDVPEKHHEGQYPCAMFDLGKKQLTIFCNSKSEDEFYGMDGNLYTTSLNNIKFTKETVFTEANFGWYPFFKRFDTGETGLVHFSFAGYFNIWSERGDDGEWKQYYYQEYISPEDAQAQAKQEGNVLVIEGGSNPSGAREAVDLGLPSGTLWATCNVGATKPEEYGDYFAWGETTPKEDYSWATYKWCNGLSTNLTKYCEKSFWGNNGFTDNKTELDLEDDAAYVNWGSNWRMPSKEQQDELLSQCKWEWTQLNGVYGCKATGPNGKSIFLPAAGSRSFTSLGNAGSYGYYWSRTLYTDYTHTAHYLNFYSRIVNWYYYERFHGHSVRPVRMSSNNSKREAIANKRYSWKGKQLENNH